VGPGGVQPAGPPALDRSPILSDGPVAQGVPLAAKRQPVALQELEDGLLRMVQVVVLREGSRAPVAGAEVLICDFDAFLEKIQRHEPPPDLITRRGIFRAMASRASTDADGNARLPLHGTKHMLDATHGDGLWGRLVLEGLPEGEGPVEILVSHDLDLRALVLSQTDRLPIAGVPVALRSDGPRWAVRRATSGPRGIATFDHLQRALARAANWRLCFGFPLHDQPVIPIVRGSLPPEPVPLIMPATGSLEISIRDEDGRAVGGGQVELEVAAFQTAERLHTLAWDSSTRAPWVDQQGRASVPFLGLDIPLRITATPRDLASLQRPVQIELDGPARSGETVTCEVLWRSTDCYPVVTGRFVRQGGRPWPEAQIDARAIIFPRPQNYVPSQEIRVAEDGRFRLVLKEACPAGGRRIYGLICRAPDELSGIEGRLDLSRTLPPGETDLGDVVLDHGVLLAAGTVVDQDGEPLPEARVNLRQLVQEGDQEFWPRYQCAGRSGLKPDGSFSLHAIPGQELPQSRLRLSVRCKGFSLTRDLDIALGQRDLRVVLVRGGALAGSIRLAPGQDAAGITLLIQGEGRTWVTDANEDGSFQEDHLPPGTVRLTAYLRSNSDAQRRASRVVVEDLQIVGGTVNRDPRIQEMSILGNTTKLTLRVHDESHDPIARAAVEIAGLHHALTDRQGVATLRPAELPIDVRVTAFGYRDVHLDAVQEDRVVVLTKGLQVRLVTDAKPIGIDPTYHLGFSIYHVHEQGHRSSRIYGRSIHYDRMYFDAAGEALLPMPGPGIYEVVPRVYLDRGDGVGRGARLPIDPSPRITVLEMEDLQSFIIVIPERALESAVRR
ncbi:MAG: hypothetical protein V3T22_09045, partial [Planctomycetota bacterium]